MNKSAEYGSVFCLGSILYSASEIVFRGCTHWTMALTGGAALWIVYRIYEKWEPAGRLLRCLAGCLCITCMELFVGSVVNCRMGLHIWDYTSFPFHFRGQICPAFTALWFALCVPADFLCAFMRDALSYTQRNHGYRLRSQKR